MPVELSSARRRIRVDLRRVKRVAERLLEGVQREKMVLSVLLTDDQEMAALHERWMGDPSPTDVLSFGGVTAGARLKKSEQVFSPAPAVTPPVLGDIAISVETAARRSPGDPMKEIEKYLVHGVLHLVGHDHAKAREKKTMWAEARRLRRLIAKES